MQTLKDLLLDRCPNCRQAGVWRTLFQMHDVCPNCHVQFEREPGYFLGAMVISWAMVNLAVLPVWLGLVFVAGVSWQWTIPVVAAEVFVLLPFLFRYSRDLWMYLDFWIDPPVDDGESDIQYRHRY